MKAIALREATIGNLERHGKVGYIHASLGNKQKVVTRKLRCNTGIDIKIQLYTNKDASLSHHIENNSQIEIINVEGMPNIEIPKFASRRLLEQYKDYDILGYMEDDISIEDPEFFSKIDYLHKTLPNEYTLIPHRCERIPGKGDVILSGDPDGGRPDLFWDTKESIRIDITKCTRIIYRATNPHSGCYFISKIQAERILKMWQKRKWVTPFQLSGPLEQAASGMLIETLKIMKPIPEDYRFFMVRHLDELWRRHEFE